MPHEVAPKKTPKQNKKQNKTKEHNGVQMEERKKRYQEGVHQLGENRGQRDQRFLGLKNWCGRNEFLRELHCADSRMLQLKISDMKTVLLLIIRWQVWSQKYIDIEIKIIKVKEIIKLRKYGNVQARALYLQCTCKSPRFMRGIECNGNL